jgi:hypothetical protein
MFINPPPKKMKVGYVYLIKSGKYHKIGLTRRDPRTRLKEITTPEGVSLVHVIETSDPEGLEQFLHNEFADKRAEREWFNLNEEDIKWICEMKKW